MGYFITQLLYNHGYSVLKTTSKRKLRLLAWLFCSSLMPWIYSAQA